RRQSAGAARPRRAQTPVSRWYRDCCFRGPGLTGFMAISRRVSRPSADWQARGDLPFSPRKSSATMSDGRRILCCEGALEMSGPIKDGVAVIKPGQTYVGKQGFTYGAGASTETVGAQKVCMNILPMPTGAVAKAHYHSGIETIAYMLH